MRPHIRELIARREKDLPKTEFEKIMHIAVEDRSVISLGPGEPDFDSPKHVVRAAEKSLAQGKTHYSTTNGMKVLREEIARKLKKVNGISSDLNNIVVTTGSTEGLFLSCLTLVEPNDKVVLPDPGYMDYIPMTELMEGTPVPFNTLNPDGFAAEIDMVKKKMDKRTHVMIVNTPSNPTGKVVKKRDLEELADLVNDREMMVFSDEAYESFVCSGNKHVSMASLNGMRDRVVSFFTFSKTYAMAGFRVGYMTGPEEVVKAINRLRLYSSLSSPVFCQEAALEALRGPQKDVEVMRKEYERRGKLIHRRLNEIGTFKCNEPEGAFYMFPDVRGFGMSSRSFAHHLVEKAKVLTVPGAEFGSNGEGHIRMSYATSYERIQEAMDRIERYVRTFSR